MVNFHILKSAPLVALTLILSACASTPSGGDPSASQPDEPIQSESRPQSGEATPVTAEYLKQPLGIIVRDLAQQSGTGVVLMNGLEAVIIPEFRVDNTPPETALNQLADLTSLAAHQTPHYTFLYDQTYESLTTLRLDDVIPSTYANVNVDIAIGSDTPLFSALALIGHSTGLTLVADNAIADASCGELSLSNVPLIQAIEAILQSARIPRSNVSILASEEYIFMASPAHRMRRDLLDESDNTQSMLDEPCSLSLLVYTGNDGQMNSQLGASPLHAVLPELSLQLGMPVKATDDVRTLPVNPMVINNVPRSTALNLIVRQWMIPAFQYEVIDGTITIKRAD